MEIMFNFRHFQLRIDRFNINLDKHISLNIFVVFMMGTFKSTLNVCISMKDVMKSNADLLIIHSFNTTSTLNPLYLQFG